MIEFYKKEYENKLKNVEINTKIAHFHRINREELSFMYKNFYETNNSFYRIDENDLLVDNESFYLYEDWLVRNDDN